MYKIGYSRVDISPTESVPLAGFGNTSQRMSEKVIDPLCSSCVALTDEKNNTVLLFHNDLIGSPAHIVDPIRESVSQATGVPIPNIIIGSTHTHSGPDLWNFGEPTLVRYLDTLPAKLTECAVAAMADRKEARAYIAKTRTHNLNFVRHYVLADGSYKGDNFGDLNNSPIVGHTTHVDNEMRLVKFVREGGEDILMVNWQVHPHRTGGADRTNVSADIIGTMRNEVEAALGCKFIYFNGGGGNVNPFSRIASEHVVDNYRDHGKALAQCAASAEGSYEEISLDDIRVLEYPHVEMLNRPDLARLEAAKKVADHWTKTNDWHSSRVLAVENGFSSQFAATNMVRRHNAASDEVYCPLTAISFGDLGFAAVPYEMFDTNAKYVRDYSPFKMTFVSSTTNASVMYIPSAYGFIHDCYEAACSQCKPGTGERLANMLIRMLEWTRTWRK